jgi:hypothetical protein
METVKKTSLLSHITDLVLLKQYRQDLDNTISDIAQLYKSKSMYSSGKLDSVNELKVTHAHAVSAIKSVDAILSKSKPGEIDFHHTCDVADMNKNDKNMRAYLSCVESIKTIAHGHLNDVRIGLTQVDKLSCSPLDRPDLDEHMATLQAKSDVVQRDMVQRSVSDRRASVRDASTTPSTVTQKLAPK